MQLVEFHVYDNNQKMSINPDAVSQLGSMPNTQHSKMHAVIHRVDGGSVETVETYEEVLALFAAKSNK